MKTSTLTAGLLTLATLPAVFAQPTPTPGYSDPVNPGASTATPRYDSRSDTRSDATTTERYGDWRASFEGPRAGDREFILTGSGLSNKDMDESSGGVGASLGFYLNDTLELVVRQSVNYANSQGDDANWFGSTRVALDQHVFVSGRFLPFVGVNFGGVYGEDVEETFVAGIEGGLKFYVLPQTFLFAMMDYAWAFEDSDEAEDNFSDGGFTWTVGVGFNF